MPDLLVHVLIAYVLCVVLSRRIEWMRPAYVTVAMAGAFLPDLAKVHLILSSWEVAQLLDVPFSWDVLHLGIGVVLTSLLTVLLVDPTERRRVLPLLLLGAVSHLVADGLLISATGKSVPFLWPVVAYAPPTPGLYTSTDPRVTVLAIVMAALVTPFAGYRDGKRET